MKAERCWYCHERRAELWCDYMLGAAAAPGIEPPPSQLGLLEEPAAKRPKRVKELADVVETCDAAACSACARRFGWRRRGHICRPRSKSTTIDHCHVHAQADSLGSSDWIGGPAVDLARREVRAACARATITTCPKEQNT